MTFPRPYGRYVLEERIAMGGMAEIFRARVAQEGFAKLVCIKRVLPHFLESDEFVAMFRDEAALAARLQHANIVQVFDFGEVEGSLYLAMELVDGADLRRVNQKAKARGERLGVGEAVQIAVDVAKGLHHAHQAADKGRRLGVVHRDVSPHNILVSKAGEVKLTDFGIAKAAERATHTSTGMVKGKIAYMSPEQADGRAIDHRTDQFATGVVLWETLTGERLFAGENDAAILRKVLACDVAAPSTLRREVPRELDDIVLKTLAPRMEQRFADMRELELALQRFLYSGAVDPSKIDVPATAARLLDEEPPRKTARIPVPNLGPTPSDLAVMDTRRSAPPDIVPTSQDDASSSSSSPFASVSVSSAQHPPISAASAEPPPAAEDDVFTSSGKAVPAPGADMHAKGPDVRTANEERADLSGTPVLTSPFAASDTSTTRTLVPTVSATPLAAAPLLATLAEPSPLLVEARRSRRAIALGVAAVVVVGGLAAAVLVATAGAPQVVAAVPSPVPVAAAPVAVPPPPAPEVEAAPLNTAPVVQAAPLVVEAAPRASVIAAAPAVVAPAGKRATGTVLVDVVGGWAEVREGGRKLGDTPVTVTLPAGAHRLKLKNPETGQEKTIDVVITAGGRSVVREQL